ncbi:hypothetical protein [Rhizobium sp. LjRoot254]|uniref:hypothetical protein n=1 Tax=Rhizobium sp. LjRoot254 TaxID=3342297 RepID=UPI003ECC895E
MRLLLHPGWSKTGTSALQTYFATFYDRYLKEGVLYPKAGRFIDNAHHGLALAAAPRAGLDFSSPLDQVLNEILAEVSSSGAQTVVISSELSPNYFEIPAFDRLFDAFDEIGVIFTLRPQSEILVSLYKQLLKDASLDFNSSILDLFLENIRWLDFETSISQWKNAAVLHRPKLDVVLYSADALIKEFASVAQLPVFEFQQRPNTSPSDLATAALAKTFDFRNSVERLGIREQFVAHVMENAKGVGIEGFPLTRDERAFIDRVFDRSNMRIAREYLGREVLFEGTARDHDHAIMNDATFQAFARLLVQSFDAGGQP